MTTEGSCTLTFILVIVRVKSRDTDEAIGLSILLMGSYKPGLVMFA